MVSGLRTDVIIFVLACTCVALFLQSQLMNRQPVSSRTLVQTDQAQCSRELFTRWALVHGIVHPNLKLGVFQLEGAGGNVSVRGVSTGIPLGVNDDVVAIPRRVVFTPENVYLQASPVQALLAAMPYKDDYPVLAMHLLYGAHCVLSRPTLGAPCVLAVVNCYGVAEQQRGPDGMFWPWICTLPPLASFEANFPLFWEARHTARVASVGGLYSF